MGMIVDGVVLEIREAENRLEVSAQNTVQRAVELGRLLAKAKLSVAHGGWEAWCEAVFEGRKTQRWVQDMIRVADRCQKNPNLLGMQSLRAISEATRETSKKTGSNTKRASLLESREAKSTPFRSAARATKEPRQDERPEAPELPVESQEPPADELVMALAVLRRRLTAAKTEAERNSVLSAISDLAPDRLSLDAWCAVNNATAVPLSADEAMAAVDAIAENLKPGNKVKFKNLMSRRWSAKDELKPASKPGDYLPSLPREPEALTHLFREFKYRLDEVKEIEPEKFRRIAERRQFEVSLAFCYETIEKLRVHVIPSTRMRFMFEDEKYPEVLRTKEFMEVWENRLDMMRKKGSIVPDTWEPNALAKLAIVGHAKALKAVSVCNGNNGFQIMYVDYEEKSSIFKGKDPSLGVPESTMVQVLCPWADVKERLKKEKSFRDRRREIRVYRGLDIDTPEFVKFA